MSLERAYHDTYYVVYNTWWLGTSFAVLALVLGAQVALLRWSSSPRVRRIAKSALVLMIIGQLISTAGILASHHLIAHFSNAAFGWISILNATSIAGAVLVLLSIALTISALVAAFTSQRAT